MAEQAQRERATRSRPRAELPVPRRPGADLWFRSCLPATSASVWFRLRHDGLRTASRLGRSRSRRASLSGGGHGALGRRNLRRFSALRCGCAYCGWFCRGGFTRRRRRCGVVIRVVAVVVLIVRRTGDAFAGLVVGLSLPLQVVQLPVEGGFQIARGTAELRQGFPYRSADLGQLLRTEKHQGKKEDERHFLPSHSAHGTSPSRGWTYS